MAIIGTFTREKDGVTGLIRTLTFTASVSIESAYLLAKETLPRHPGRLPT